jgi:hypothetical protein
MDMDWLRACALSPLSRSPGAWQLTNLVSPIYTLACLVPRADADPLRIDESGSLQACRMATELGLNRYSRRHDKENPLQHLERRNRERTYLVLWVHDRSLSMQNGRQWMLPEVRSPITPLPPDPC